MGEKWLYWFEELGSEYNEVVGKKCANIGEMTKLGMQVPPGFAVSVDGWKLFMEQTGAGEELRRYVDREFTNPKDISQQAAAGKAIRRIIETRSMPARMMDEVLANYEKLCRRTGVENLPVAVRSSGAVSMPGQMETYLNIRGGREAAAHIIKVWASAFTTRAISFRVETGMDIAEAPIGVAVLKMVKPKSAGVALTVLPNAGDATKAVVEGNWGLGESVVSGQITPDSFVVDKETKEVHEEINRKTKMVVYQDHGAGMTDVPPHMQNKSCLTREELLEIVRVACRVEEHFGVPQDMEWVIDDALPFPDNLYWGQTRPAKFAAKKEKDSEYLAELMTRLFQA
jgi:pyruvate,water dikinase